MVLHEDRTEQVSSNLSEADKVVRYKLVGCRTQGELETVAVDFVMSFCRNGLLYGDNSRFGDGIRSHSARPKHCRFHISF